MQCVCVWGLYKVLPESLFSTSGLSLVRASSLIESFCMWTVHLYLSLVPATDLSCLYRKWLRVFHEACRHNISTYEPISKLKTCIWFIYALIYWFFKLWDSVEVVGHALLILCCTVKRWLYVHNYWWTHNKINYELFFHDWSLYLFSTYKIQSRAHSSLCLQLYTMQRNAIKHFKNTSKRVRKSILKNEINYI